MRWTFILAGLLILAASFPALAQQPDTLQPVLAPAASAASPTRPTEADSITDPVDSEPRGGFWGKNYPNPRTAVILGIIPGLGQIYNKKWWKVPLVYGALGGMLWWEIDNIKQYRKLRDNYAWLVDGDPNTFPTEEPYTNIDATAMRQYRDQWRRYVEQTSLGLGLVYLLSVTDAFVDAHLASFDVSEDLSLRLAPALETGTGFGPSFGLGVRMQLGRKRTPPPPFAIASPVP